MRFAPSSVRRGSSGILAEQRPGSVKRTASEGSGTGPAITVSGVANFGGPIDTVSQAGFDFNQSITQVIDNFTLIRGRHSIKMGFDAQFIADSRENAMFQLYTFANTASYQAARTGANPKAYSTYAELVGEKLRRMRQDRGLSLQEVCARSGGSVVVSTDSRSAWRLASTPSASPAPSPPINARGASTSRPSLASAR